MFSIEFVQKLTAKYLEPLLTLLESYNQTETRHNLLSMLAEKFPDNSFIHIHLAKFYSQNGRQDDAETEFETAIKINPEEPSFYFYLISACIQNSKLDKLASIIEEIELRFSSNPEVISRVNMLKQKLAQFIS